MGAGGAATDGLHVETVEDEPAFEALAPEWDALLATSAEDGPFLTHDWLSAWWEAFGHGRLCVLTCRDDGGALVGVMPLFTSERGRFPHVRVARYLGDEHVGSTGLTAFARPDVAARVLDRLVAETRRPDWDVLDLRFMDPAHAFFDRLAATPAARVVPDQAVCPRIALPADWDSYLGMLSKHRRHEVRRAERRVRERGLEFEIVTRPEDLSVAVEDFLALHESRMRTKMTASYSVPPKMRAFNSRTMRDLLAKDRLRLMFLRCDRRRLGVMYHIRYGGIRYAVQSGFDDEAASQDVMRALWAYSIRDAIEDGAPVLDLLIGDQRYKTEWLADDVRRLSAVHVYGRSLTAVARRGQDAFVRRHPRLVEQLSR